MRRRLNQTGNGLEKHLKIDYMGCMNAGEHIILIGMPGVGKSTVGKRLSARLGCRYVDTDELIEVREGLRLAAIIRREGLSGFCRIEARTVSDLSFAGSPLVVATGGSVVYSDAAMRRLQSVGKVVFLDLTLAELRSRLGDLQDRGVVVGPDQGLDELWSERHPLYLKWADIVFDCSGLSAQAAADALAARLAPGARKNPSARDR